MRIYPDDQTARCFRCDSERVGPLRLTIDTRGLSPDEAARWLIDDAVPVSEATVDLPQELPTAPGGVEADGDDLEDLFA